MPHPTDTIIHCLSKSLFAASVFAAGAGQVMASPLAISNCWIRVLPGQLPSAGYFVVSNTSEAPVALTAVKTSAFRMAMLHQTQMQSGTARMVKVDKVKVPAHGKLTFSPGNYHLMLEHPVQPLKAGSKLPLTFIFDGGKEVTATCQVKPASAID